MLETINRYLKYMQLKINVVFKTTYHRQRRRRACCARGTQRSTSSCSKSLQRRVPFQKSLPAICLGKKHYGDRFEEAQPGHDILAARYRCFPG